MPTFCDRCGAPVDLGDAACRTCGWPVPVPLSAEERASIGRPLRSGSGAGDHAGDHPAADGAADEPTRANPAVSAERESITQAVFGRREESSEPPATQAAPPVVTPVPPSAGSASPTPSGSSTPSASSGSSASELPAWADALRMAPPQPAVPGSAPSEAYRRPPSEQPPSTVSPGVGGVGLAGIGVTADANESVGAWMRASAEPGVGAGAGTAGPTARLAPDGRDENRYRREGLDGGDGDRRRVPALATRALIGLVVAVVVVLVGLYVLFFGVLKTPDKTPSVAATGRATQATSSAPGAAPETPSASSTPSSSPSSATPSSSPTSYPALTLPGSVCGGQPGGGPWAQVAAGTSATSCGFAQAVQSAYLAAKPTPGATVAVTATSPVTKKPYAMACTGNQPVTCKGGNNAVVYLYGGTATFTG